MRRFLATVLIYVAGACVTPAQELRTELTVFAASSLSDVFPEIDPHARFHFAGSDELALQIREGAPADVFAAASPVYAAVLFEEGLVERPIAFATNELVLIVPRDNPASIASIDDLRAPDVRLLIGAPGVPVGDYTRRLLSTMGAEDVLDRVVSEEESVTGIVGKVALGEADAGFVYTTDAAAAGERVRTITVTSELQPDISYTVAVVAASARRDAARHFIESLTGTTGRSLLRAVGFGLP